MRFAPLALAVALGGGRDEVDLESRDHVGVADGPVGGRRAEQACRAVEVAVPGGDRRESADPQRRARGSRAQADRGPRTPSLATPDPTPAATVAGRAEAGALSVAGGAKTLPLGTARRPSRALQAVRKGSTVRVRQRALEKAPLRRGSCLGRRIRFVTHLELRLRNDRRSGRMARIEFVQEGSADGGVVLRAVVRGPVERVRRLLGRLARSV
jgi:hypothetical protein